MAPAVGLPGPCTAAQIAARIRAGAVMVFSLYVHRLVVWRNNLRHLAALVTK